MLVTTSNPSGMGPELEGTELLKSVVVNFVVVCRMVVVVVVRRVVASPYSGGMVEPLSGCSLDFGASVITRTVASEPHTSTTTPAAIAKTRKGLLGVGVGGSGPVERSSSIKGLLRALPQPVSVGP